MSGDKYVIESFAAIKKGRILSNGKLVHDSPEEKFEELMDSVYRLNNLSYPKFHKMDHLSKLGFMTSEFLLKDYNLTDSYSSDKIGVVLANKSSSLDTDLKYNAMLRNGIASPAVFVYTLPNILIGEICIRNKIKGESVFFISDHYKMKEQIDYIKLLFATEVIDACISGWVEFIRGNYESFLYLVTRKDDQQGEEFSNESLTKLYNLI